METKTKSTVTGIVPEVQETKKLKVLSAKAVQEAQIIEAMNHKPNLAETMRIIDDLHTKTKHRNKLEVYHDLLGQFQIKNEQEDLLEQRYYNGCLLTIKDDNRESFELKNPALIKEVVNYLMTRFDEKRQEIEAEIILPN